MWLLSGSFFQNPAASSLIGRRGLSFLVRRQQPKHPRSHKIAVNFGWISFNLLGVFLERLRVDAKLKLRDAASAERASV